MKDNRRNLALAALLIFLVAASRVFNAEHHLYNFAPVAALGLFSGAVVKDKRLAFLFTLLAQFSADLYFQLFTKTPGFYGLTQLFTYGGMAAVTALGFLMQNRKAPTVLGFAIAGSLVFFLISNFGVWLGGMYGYSVGGFAKTFIMGIPFYKNTLAGDVLFSGVLFGAYSLMERSVGAAVGRPSVA